MLSRWTGAWAEVRTSPPPAGAATFEDLPADGLYWLVAKESRKRLERPFTIEAGRQRFW